MGKRKRLLKQMPSERILEAFLASVVGDATVTVVFDRERGKFVWLDLSEYVETKEDRNTKTP